MRLYKLEPAYFMLYIMFAIHACGSSLAYKYEYVMVYPYVHLTTELKCFTKCCVWNKNRNWISSSISSLSTHSVNWISINCWDFPLHYVYSYWEILQNQSFFFIVLNPLKFPIWMNSFQVDGNLSNYDVCDN